MIESLVLLLILLWFFKPFFGSIVLATIFSTLLYPLYKKRPGYLSAALLTLLCVVVSFLFVYHFSFYLYDQVNYIFEIFNTFSPELQLRIIDVGSQVPTYEFLSGLLLSLPGVTIRALLTFIATFFFLKDGDKIKDALKKIFPHKKANALMKEGSQNLRAIVMGVFASMFAYTILGTIVLSITNTPMALLYATLAGLFGPIPIVSGSMVFAWIIFQKFMAGQYLGATILIIYLILWHTVADFYFRMKYRGNMHPGILIFSMFAGVKVFGFAGLVVGPVLTSLAYTWIVVESKL
ncbi:MAG: AI-2E family transporter [Candidatus Altiarchaeota archaeon]|nr:AI-2E family transporter [Candidatus Altiarchaeota archaeon]